MGRKGLNPVQQQEHWVTSSRPQLAGTSCPHPWPSLSGQHTGFLRDKPAWSQTARLLPSDAHRPMPGHGRGGRPTWDPGATFPLGRTEECERHQPLLQANTLGSQRASVLAWGWGVGSTRWELQEGKSDGDQVPGPLASAGGTPLTFQGGLARSLARKPLHAMKSPQACGMRLGQVANTPSLDHVFSGLRRTHHLISFWG